MSAFLVFILTIKVLCSVLIELKLHQLIHPYPTNCAVKHYSNLAFVTQDRIMWPNVLFLVLFHNGCGHSTGPRGQIRLVAITNITLTARNSRLV